MAFEDLLKRFIELRAAGKYKEAEELEPAVDRYFQLLKHGVSPETARIIIDLYLE